MLEPNWLDEVLESINEERTTLCPPVSPGEKTTGGQITEPETRMDKGSSNYVPPVPPVPPVPRESDRFVKKSADIEETQIERQRERVLAILAENPDTQRAIITDLDSDPDNAVLTIAIRDKYSFEMLIPKDRYDGFLMLEIIQKSGVQ